MVVSILAFRRAALAATGALALGTSLGACGSSSTSSSSDHGRRNGRTSVVKLDTKRVALAIVQSIKSEKHLTATVRCPPDITQRKGNDFTCTATTYARVKGKRIPVHTQFTVKQINDRGNVDYASPPK